MDDNLFDEDEALDYVLYEKMDKSDKRPPTKTGCLGSLILFWVIGTLIGYRVLT
ncbi:hypothetical protein GF1_05200 [Desulfolithobacter dissulfuricans]|uniref:Uncharacterized protein n=1 Tax=Desulfolithobacter dissulfuricans TaxID=2795293 RepID=A0A915TYJ2_9BACT|nr:hypothetical protein [Desulfolithobacter dissulfuricans]BCO08144.1 hypothetical protein GF1_05200 [Desulfolithobacter dissulfuricans]